ncbi:MAG: TraB/GumN family protein [Planctomycetota bacterium]|nr:TraB/GumN family protein [Planctomycetota bacterium]
MRPVLSPLLAAGILLFAGCGAATSPSTAAAGGALLWRVEGPGGNGWLLGTMHVSEPRAVILVPAAEAAFSTAGALYTEIDGGLAAAAFVQQAGTLPPTQPLKDLLPPILHRRLAGHLQSRQLRINEFERFRPWLATLMLGQLDAIELLRHGPPLDEVLRTRARDAGKTLGAVETVQEQIAALSCGTEEQQIHLLDLALTQLEADHAAGRNRLMELFAAWSRGDEAALVRLQSEEVDLEDEAQRLWWEALFTQRNRNMAERVDRILRAPDAQEPMFAFGAMHFVGTDSVVERLRALGWRVERVKR